MRELRRPPGGGPTGRFVRRGRLAEAVERLPRPRLTALGVGVLVVVLMLLLGALDALLLEGHRPSYGVCFVMVSAAGACWVRPAELYAAPVAAPLAFTAGLLFVSPGSGGFAGVMMGLFTGLSTEAAWVYGGTLLAGLIVLVRRGLDAARRRAERVESGAGFGALPAGATALGAQAPAGAPAGVGRAVRRGRPARRPQAG
ncbi:hypothetical protein RM572_04005 [Streptomyces sp. DSM 42041]|uniref:DUF6542 domain-containing protein n=1 Tax=Streptomyces hazeniae TaxID=3075538 RepID=A0ABU2NLS7_9ACTN|nr:DUF6542 domain-containing protein [Streptomyces sp. DSM 42041]MDT0377937.1 hypothetical protein [Streptomyces sp. DSM 42041]